MPRGQGVYQVSGARAIWLLENNEWHWCPTQDSFFAWGYSWADVQVIDLATFCQYPVGQSLSADGSSFSGDRGYIPSSDRAALDCSKVAPPEPTPPPDEPTPPAPNEPTPAGFLRIAWPYSPWGTHDQLRSAFRGLLDLGINAFCCYRHIEDYRDESYATVRYDTRYNIAAEMGIKIIQYTGVHRLHYRGAKTGEAFITRYSKFPACAGFLYGDEPALQGWDHDGPKWAVDEAHRQGAGLPDHPMFPVWNYGLTSEMYNRTCRPNWCELYDIAAVDCYPTALRGDGWKSFLEYWVNWYYHTDKGDGFGDCGKGMIPVIQAHVEAGGKYPNMMPDTVGEYNVWKAKYGNSLKGIAFWLPYASGASVGFLESGSKAENLRNQIKEVSRLTGWSPEEFTTQEVTCSGCGAVLELTISSIPENNISQGCPVCGTPAD